MDRPGRPTLSGPGTPAQAHSRHGQLEIISKVGTLFFCSDGLWHLISIKILLRKQQLRTHSAPWPACTWTCARTCMTHHVNEAYSSGEPT